MSARAISWARTTRTGSGTLKAVLLAVAARAGEDHNAWLSRRQLADETEFNERTVTRSLAALERRGLIRREAYHYPDRSRGPDIIHLMIGAAQAGDAS